MRADRVSPARIVEQPVARAEEALAAKDVEVEVKPAAEAPRGDLAVLTKGIQAPPTGGKVTLYEDQGVVRFYAVEPTAAPAPAPEVKRLSAELDKARGQITARDDQLRKLRSEVDALQRRQAQLEEAAPAIEEVTREVEELRTLKDEVRRLMEGEQ
jgi:hypothetical protein